MLDGAVQGSDGPRHATQIEFDPVRAAAAARASPSLAAYEDAVPSARAPL